MIALIEIILLTHTPVIGEINEKQEVVQVSLIEVKALDESRDADILLTLIPEIRENNEDGEVIEVSLIEVEMFNVSRDVITILKEREYG